MLTNANTQYGNEVAALENLLKEEKPNSTVYMLRLLQEDELTYNVEVLSQTSGQELFHLQALFAVIYAQLMQETLNDGGND